MKQLLTNLNQSLENVCNISEVIEKYLNEEDIKASSKRTYKNALKIFFDWIKCNGINTRSINKATILEYKEYLKNRGVANLTVAGYLTALRNLYKYLESEEITPNIMQGIKTPKRKNKFMKQHLTEEQCKELLNTCSSLRDKTIMYLMIKTGLRTVEVTRLNISDITFKQGKRVLLVFGKGRDSKDDFVQLTDKTYEVLREYINTMRKKAKGGEPLFVSESDRNKGGRLTNFTISKMIKKYFRQIGIDSKDYTAHSLRHTTAVCILKNGGTLMDAQNVLRHAKLETTQIYVETIKEIKRLQECPESLLDNLF